MKQLLAICWEMPPLSGPRAVQVTRTLSALGEFGWESRVICFGARSNRYHQDHHVSLETLSGGHAARIPVPSPEEWLFFRALWRVAPPIKHLPDEKRVWMPAALRAARSALAQTPADLIVSFGPPWTDHLIALQLHRETGAPWVAHFSDPWVDSPYFRHGGFIRSKALGWEREVLDNAARVVFVNGQARDRVMAKYPGSWKAKTDVIPQAFEPAATEAPMSMGTPRPMRMVYTGRFYDRLRTPDTLLQAIADLHRESPLDATIAIEFVGADMEAYAARAAQLGLSRLVMFSGRLSPQQAWARAAGADVLLVIDAPAEGGSLFLPSKLIEYLPFRRPIFGITPASGPSGELIRELGYPIADPSDAAAIAAVVQRMMKAHAAGRLVPSLQHDSVAARFSVAKTTRAFAAAFEKAVSP